MSDFFFNRTIKVSVEIYNSLISDLIIEIQCCDNGEIDMRISFCNKLFLVR